MEYRQKRQESHFTTYGQGKIEPLTIEVSIAPGFVKTWEHGRYFHRHNPQPIIDRLGHGFSMGYMELSNDGRYRLRFPERSIVIPLHQNGSETSMEAHGFYHERRPFQLGRRQTNPAQIKSGKTGSGLVEVFWKTLY
ncbi:MAG: hypothetical protein HYT71_02305 [Candidatus Aenigmarchaeota archaeon]|nr:hypothetical protein [Candidatus Aenigmarchaeota archaeon]